MTVLIPYYLYHTTTNSRTPCQHRRAAYIYACHSPSHTAVPAFISYSSNHTPSSSSRRTLTCVPAFSVHPARTSAAHFLVGAERTLCCFVSLSATLPVRDYLQVRNNPACRMGWAGCVRHHVCSTHSTRRGRINSCSNLLNRFRTLGY
jgi:hypothetical protein